MMVTTLARPVSGITGEVQMNVLPERSVTTNPFERLTQIIRENELLLERLDLLGRRLRRARAYAGDVAAKPAFATVLVEHARLEYAEVLKQVRANRAESLGILRACGQIGAIENN